MSDYGTYGSINYRTRHGGAVERGRVATAGGSVGNLAFRVTVGLLHHVIYAVYWLRYE